MTPEAPRNPTDEAALNRRFSAVERSGALAGVVFAVAAVALYFSGLVEPLIPIKRLMASWGLEVDAYRARTGAPAGWAWLADLGHSDNLSLASLAFLASVMGLTYLAILPLLWRRRDWIYLGLALAQVAVFALAASGWLGTGGL